MELEFQINDERLGDISPNHCTGHTYTKPVSSGLSEPDIPWVPCTSSGGPSREAEGTPGGGPPAPAGEVSTRAPKGKTVPGRLCSLGRGWSCEHLAGAQVQPGEECGQSPGLGVGRRPWAPDPEPGPSVWSSPLGTPVVLKTGSRLRLGAVPLMGEPGRTGRLPQGRWAQDALQPPLRGAPWASRPSPLSSHPDGHCCPSSPARLPV